MEKFFDDQIAKARQAGTGKEWVRVRNAFFKLTPNGRSDARDGIVRHVRATRQSEMDPDHLTIAEIIVDADGGRRVWEEGDTAAATA